MLSGLFAHLLRRCAASRRIFPRDTMAVIVGSVCRCVGTSTSRYTMYARIATGQLQPGKMDQLLDMYQKYWATAPQKGLVGGRQLFDRATDKLISLTTWETLADLEANTRAVKQ